MNSENKEEDINERKEQCNIIHKKFKELKNTIINRGQVAINLFATSVVISALITILFIPKVYSWLIELIPNTYYRLFVLFVFLIALIYLVERILFNLEFF